MKSQVRDAGDVKVVELQGKITMGSGGTQMRDTIAGLVSGGTKKVVVNLGGVTTIDSSGIGELTGCFTTLRNNSGELVLANLPAKISDLLTMTQLITVFKVFKTEEEAVASFKKG